MRINYKEPYWLKFSWDLSTHHEHQFVTEFNKVDNNDIRDFFFLEDFMITVSFRIPKRGERDEISAIFGKSGKNLALSYNTTTETLGFEFWTKQKDGDKPNFVHFLGVSRSDVEKGVTLSIVREGNYIYLLEGFGSLSLLKRESFEGEMIDDYRSSPLYFGVANPGTDLKHHRFFGELDLNYFLMVGDVSNQGILEEIHNTEVERLVTKPYYHKILCLHNFKKQNNLGFVYDESMYTNFLEIIPTEFIL